MSHPDQPGNRAHTLASPGRLRRRSDSTASGEADKSRMDLFLFGLFPAATILLLRRIGLSSQLAEGLIQGGVL